MIRFTTFAIIIVLSACVLFSELITPGAESYNSMRLTPRLTRSVATQSVEASSSPERGGRSRLQTQDGVALGEIEDFLIEPEKGCIAYGVLARTNLSTPDRLVILPWILIQLDPGDQTVSNFRLQGEQDLLGTAPQVSRVQWTTSPVADLLGEAEQYWTRKGVQLCAIPTAADAHVIKASDVVGMDIRTDNGASLGTIRELIMNGERGLIASVIVVREDPSGPLQRSFFALPWSMLHVNISHHTVLVHLGTQTAL